MGETGRASLAGRTGAQDAVTVSTLLRQAQAALAETLRIPAAGARIEARMLLARALGDVSHAWLIAHEGDATPVGRQAEFDTLLQRRLAGEPIAYILGEREFFGLNFKVTPAVLIPRPETELLVELALKHLPSPGLAATLSRERKRGWGRGCEFRVLDLGTGSGAIALTIAHARPDVEVTAVDASQQALEVARENMLRLNLKNVHLLRSDWFSALDCQRFDMIVSNPPYIAAGDAHLAQGDLRFEPASALASGPDGLDDIRHIVAAAPGHLRSGGWLLFEHGYDQAAQARELLQQGGFSAVFSTRDLGGIERVSGGRAARAGCRNKTVSK